MVERRVVVILKWLIEVAFPALHQITALGHQTFFGEAKSASGPCASIGNRVASVLDTHFPVRNRIQDVSDEDIHLFQIYQVHVWLAK